VILRAPHGAGFIKEKSLPRWEALQYHSTDDRQKLPSQRIIAPHQEELGKKRELLSSYNVHLIISKVKSQGQYTTTACFWQLPAECINTTLYTVEFLPLHQAALLGHRASSCTCHLQTYLLRVNRLPFDAVGRFHQRLTQRGMGMDAVGDLFGGQFGIVGQYQLWQ
jgi:hypothetical protein